jgi:ribonuclease P protein component
LRIGRVSERRAFERLVRDGVRGQSRTLWCRYLADPQVVPPRLAFSIGRTLGTAVERNRLRRRLRMAIGSRAGSPALDNGWLLVGARAPALEQTFAELDVEVGDMLTAVMDRRSAVGAPGTRGDRGGH